MVVVMGAMLTVFIVQILLLKTKPLELTELAGVAVELHLDGNIRA